MKASIVKIAVLALPALIAAQSTLTLSNCHAHADGVEYCQLPDGSEVPYTTRVPSATSTGSVPASTTPAAAAVTPSVDLSAVTEVTGCHAHGSEGQYCIAGSGEAKVISGGTASATSYSGCHAHDSELHCTGGGQDVTLALEGAQGTSDGHAHSGDGSAAEGGLPDANSLPAGVSCHTHAGVPHCVDAQGNTVSLGCARPNNEYNVPLRIGLLFVILATSGLGVFLPILTAKFSNFNQDHIVLVGVRQFGTGVIISTAIVHLFTHASLYFSNECLTGLKYEATTGAIMMAGLFVTFLIEYTAKRVFGRHHCHGQHHDVVAVDTKTEHSPARNDEESAESASLKQAQTDTLKVTLMEAGIIFHSVLIGLTLVVAPNSGFITLFVVILFHQLFEGLALGARISMLTHKSFLHRSILAIAFAVTTPIGMAIGIGVLSTFNGNDPSTIIAIGTLNAFSAGILLWVGVVEMWYDEWWLGPLANSGAVKTTVGMVALIAGLVLMSFLGKWA